MTNVKLAHHNNEQGCPSGTPAPNETYRPQRYSWRAALGLFAAVLGSAGIGCSIAFSYFPEQSISWLATVIDLVVSLLMPSIAMLIAGLALILLDIAKRKLYSPDKWEIKNDFASALIQLNVLPYNFRKEQLKVKVKKRTRNEFTLFFNLHSTYFDVDARAKIMKQVADYFGCSDKYEFTENSHHSSKYGRGYQYLLTINLSSVEEAYKDAGEYRG